MTERDQIDGLVAELLSMSTKLEEKRREVMGLSMDLMSSISESAENWAEVQTLRKKLTEMTAARDEALAQWEEWEAHGSGPESELRRDRIAELRKIGTRSEP